jgi:hypothetical protein
MIDTITPTGTWTIQWLAAHPTVGFLSILFLQVGLIAAAAAIVAGRTFEFQAQQIHAVWLSAVTLVVGLIPIHLTLGGWPIEVATAELRYAKDKASRGLDAIDTMILDDRNQSADALPRWPDATHMGQSPELAETASVVLEAERSVRRMNDGPLCCTS